MFLTPTDYNPASSNVVQNFTPPPDSQPAPVSKLANASLMCGLLGWLSFGGSILFLGICSVWNLSPETYLPDYVADTLLWCLVLIFPIALWLSAILLGGIGQHRIKQSCEKTTACRKSIDGRVFGYAGLVILIICITMSSINWVYAITARAVSDAKQIGLACKMYATDHGHNFPQTLDDLVPDYLPERKYFHESYGGDDEHGVGFDYFGGKDTDPPDKVLLRSKITIKYGRRVYVYVDGSAELKK
jgi:hypothetical protein